MGTIFLFFNTGTILHNGHLFPLLHWCFSLIVDSCGSIPEICGNKDNTSSGSSGWVSKGVRARNMKSMRVSLAAIFFYDLFSQGRGTHDPWPPRPLDPLLNTQDPSNKATLRVTNKGYILYK